MLRNSSSTSAFKTVQLERTLLNWPSVILVEMILFWVWIIP